MLNGCSLPPKQIGITDNVVFYSFKLSLTLIVLWVVELSRTNSVFPFYVEKWIFSSYLSLQF